MAADPLTRQTVDDLLFNDDLFGSDAEAGVERAGAPAAGPDRDDKVTLSPRKRKAVDDGVNVDDEITINKKKRKQIAKLDAERLLSAPGIPKMRELVRSKQLKKKLRLKGKGHEFSDAARLLTYYQLWLDNLYPRAKFADALQLVEKAGHGKRMHIMRKEWIDQSKPSYQVNEISGNDERAASDRQDQPITARGSTNDQVDHDDIPEDTDALFFASDEQPQVHIQDAPDEDELDALMAEHDAGKPVSGIRDSVPVDIEDNDDLDALMAEQDARKYVTGSGTSAGATAAEVEDDLDALLAEQDTRIQTNGVSTRHIQQDTVLTEEIDDDLEALLNEDSQERDDMLPIPKVQSTTNSRNPVELSDDSDDADDLEALLQAEPKIKDRPEPTLPDVPSPKITRTKSGGIELQQVTPGSEEVPELDNTISSDPVPNVATDDLDQLMDEHDASVKRTEELAEHFMSSSPIPNDDSQ